MNKGWIEQTNSGQFVVVEINEMNFENEFPLHPFFKNKEFTPGETVNFQLSMECSRHYPFICDCLKLTTYALPVIKKRKSWFQKIFRKWTIMKFGCVAKHVDIFTTFELTNHVQFAWNMNLTKDEIKRFKEFRNIMLVKKSEMYADGNFNAVLVIKDLIQQFYEINKSIKQKIENEKIDH